jgi:hypothetical protein
VHWLFFYLSGTINKERQREAGRALLHRIYATKKPNPFNGLSLVRKS